MFKYLWMVVQDLFPAVTFAALTHALLFRLLGRTGRRIHAAGLIAGTAASAVLAAVKFNTKLIISSHWNHYLYAILLVLSLLLFVLVPLFGRKERPEGKKAGTAALCAAGAALSAVWIFYSLPGVLLYPFNFNTMGEGYFSSYYATRMLGWLAALILLAIYARLLSGCALEIKPFGCLPAVTNAILLVNAVYWFGRFFVPWVNRAKWLGWSVRYTDEAYRWIGSWMMFTADYSMLFLWITFVLAAVPAVVYFRQGTVLRDPYDNSAQLRKLKARNRGRRRIASAVAAFLLVFVLVLTVVKADDTRKVELSAPEHFTVDEAEGVVRIAMEDVSDGHLHRFEYTTPNGINVRWIVVKKPNSASFGVGLDACEVCGNAGYFERNGQVICKRCDVVMNINTIGFKGGCNPIPLACEVKDGSLVFSLEDLLAGEKEFK